MSDRAGMPASYDEDISREPDADDSPRQWVSDSLRQRAVPDEYGRVSPFAVYVYYPATCREIVSRNLLLADAEAMADRELAAGRRVHVSLDTCG
jgi:hypothetical protein